LKAVAIAVSRAVLKSGSTMRRGQTPDAEAGDALRSTSM
jgi:hypothetical protein